MTSTGAMLWENWRLTRVEAAQRLALGLLVGAAALVFNTRSGSYVAFWGLVVIHGIFWLSIAKLNGGRFVDGYKPGFPLYLLYTRPVSTRAIVGVAMVYDAASCAALYLASAAFLGYVFGQPLPLFSAAVWVFTYHVASLAVQWTTRSRAAQWIGSLVVAAPAFLLLKERVSLLPRLEFSLAEYAAMALVGAAAFGIAVAGVARQRSGDAIASVPEKSKAVGYPDWLVSLFRFPCPTSSATRAQLWFELKSSGVPVLAVGFSLALAIFLLFAMGIPFVPLRPFAMLSVIIAVPAVLLLLGSNAFGIRRRQGRTYFSAFEATQPNGTARLAALKVLVRSGCILLALILVVVSSWASSSLISAWAPWLVEGNQDAALKLLKFRNEFGAAFRGLTPYTLAAVTLLAPVVVALLVASFAAFTALRARYLRRMLFAAALLLAGGYGLILVVLITEQGIAVEFRLESMLRVAQWIALALLVPAAVYLLWSGFSGRALTIRYLCGAVLASVAVAAAGPPAASGVSLWLPVLLSLVAGLLAPWALDRVRHG